MSWRVKVVPTVAMRRSSSVLGQRPTSDDGIFLCERLFRDMCASLTHDQASLETATRRGAEGVASVEVQQRGIQVLGRWPVSAVPKKCSRA